MTAQILDFTPPNDRCLACAKWCRLANPNSGWCARLDEETNADFVCDDFESRGLKVRNER